MSDTSCPHCGAFTALIQSGAGERMAKEEDVPLLGKVPTSKKISSTLDDGEPFVIRHPDSEEAKVLFHIADAVIRHCDANMPSSRQQGARKEVKRKMTYDLRNFIYDLKKAGELIEVDKEVDWNYEISAFEVMSARVGGPAFLFNNIKGIPGGRVLLGHFAGILCRPHRRIARALGMNPDADWFTFVQNLVPKMSLH